jgi:hypothetical protein
MKEMAAMGDAVRRCVHCEFDQRKASLDMEALGSPFIRRCTATGR